MKHWIITFISILCLGHIHSSELYAQDNLYVGARSAGLSHTSSTLADEYSIFNNPGSLGGLNKNTTIGLGYYDLYGVEGLSSVFATFTTPVKNGHASIGLFSFGDEAYKRDKISIGYGNKLGISSLGFGINYHHISVEGYGSSGFISIDLGGLAKLGSQVFISGVIKNVGQSKVSKNTGEYYPTTMTIGLSYHHTDQLILNTQYDKDLENDGLFKIGLEYTYSALVLRTGLITEPAQMSFGIGFHHRKIKIDYGLINHPILGQGHTFSLSYKVGQ